MRLCWCLCKSTVQAVQLVVVDIDVDVGDIGDVCGVGDVQVNHIRCALVFVMKNEH